MNVILYLEESKDYSLMGFRQNREALLIGEEDAGGEDGCFDRFSEPFINHSV